MGRREELFRLAQGLVFEADGADPAFLDEMTSSERIRRFLQTRASLLGHGESAAITFALPRTAAMCYDRVWDPTGLFVPDAIRCSGTGLLEEVYLASIAVSLGERGIHPQNLPTSLSGAFVLPHRYGDTDPLQLPPDADLRNLLSGGKWIPSIPMIPVYAREMRRSTRYMRGDITALVAVLTNLGIVDEDSVSWDQVLAFRADVEARGKYKRMLHWLDGNMVGKSRSFIEDDVAQKLEDYQAALTKYGIKTVVGTVSSTLAVAAGGALAGGLPGILVGTGLGIANIIASVIKAALELEEIERRGPNSEVAWVYEVKDKLGESARS